MSRRLRLLVFQDLPAITQVSNAGPASKAAILLVARKTSGQAFTFAQIAMRKKTKRKQITPYLNTLERVKWLAAPLDSEVKLAVLANLQASIDAMRGCSQTTDDWGQVMLGINLLESFIRAGTIKDKSKNAQEFVHELQEVVTQVMTRHRDTHSNVLTPSELAAFGDLYGVLSDVLESATNGEYLKAKDYLENRIRSIVGVKTFKRGELYTS